MSDDIVSEVTDLKIELMEKDLEGAHLKDEIELLKLITDAMHTERTNLIESLRKWHLVAFKAIDLLEGK